jgi:predicted amidohydrolase
MKIAIAQMDIVRGEKEKNLERGLSLIEEAAERGSDMVILPELWTTGYVRHLHDLAEPLDGKTIKTLERNAKKHEIKIFGTIIERAERYYNTMHYISPKGLEASYRKMYLFSLMNEERFFSPGSSIGITGEIGMLICYDLRFPALARSLVRDGAEMLIVSAEWPYPRKDHWRTLLKARAIDNLSYVI